MIRKKERRRKQTIQAVIPFYEYRRDVLKVTNSSTQVTNEVLQIN
jgi:hypothetical protein